MLVPSLILAYTILHTCTGIHKCFDLPKDASSPEGKEYTIRCCDGRTSFLVNGDAVSMTKTVDPRCGIILTSPSPNAESSWKTVGAIFGSVLMGAVLGCFVCAVLYKWHQRRRIRRFTNYGTHPRARWAFRRRWLHARPQAPPMSPAPNSAPSGVPTYPQATLARAPGKDYTRSNSTSHFDTGTGRVLPGAGRGASSAKHSDSHKDRFDSGGYSSNDSQYEELAPYDLRVPLEGRLTVQLFATSDESITSEGGAVGGAPRGTDASEMSGSWQPPPPFLEVPRHL